MGRWVSKGQCVCGERPLPPAPCALVGVRRRGSVVEGAGVPRVIILSPLISQSPCSDIRRPFVSPGMPFAFRPLKNLGADEGEGGEAAVRLVMVLSVVVVAAVTC